MPDLLETMRATGTRSIATASPATGSTSAGTTITPPPTRSSRPAGRHSWAVPTRRCSRSGATSERADELWIQYPLGCLLGYLVGSIPFGYLVYYWVRGVDIRTVGSGNIGATNVGRNLGFRYFLLVFALDVFKGFVPTLGVPLGLKSMGILPPADLPVFIALASILGHNFPVYLRFKGGKGVATSLGGLLALDPLACGAAAVCFFIVFFLTRYVSLSSIAGALAFAVGHFARAASPGARRILP